jgi:hypothetical protein
MVVVVSVVNVRVVEVPDVTVTLSVVTVPLVIVVDVKEVVPIPRQMNLKLLCGTVWAPLACEKYKPPWPMS